MNSYAPRGRSRDSILARSSHGRRGGFFFDWDEGNQTKHAKHDVAPIEIEAMLRHPLLFAGRIVEPAHPETRWLMLGTTDTGRHLALIFTRRGEKLPDQRPPHATKGALGL